MGNGSHCCGSRGRCSGYGDFGEGADLAEQARIDLDAVRAAGVLWYVAPASKSEGSHGEFCAALVLGKLVVASGPVDASRIFPRLAAHRFAEHAEALEFLKRRIVELERTSA